MNDQKTRELREIIDEMLSETLRRGFWGIGRVTLAVQDGIIQQVKGEVERSLRRDQKSSRD